MNASTTQTPTQPAVGSKVVQARGVSKIFKRDAFEVTALDNVSLDIAGGEFLALMGPSGSGKTTLLNMIAAIDRPTSGELLVMGENVFRLNDAQSAKWRNTHVGYVFQTFNLIPVLTAFENVELPLLLTKMTPQQRRDHVMTALKLVGLEDRVHHLPKQLSGGQEQRVAIARAIVSDPTLILADEPTGDLDSNSATDILEILKRLNESFHKTIVMVTHDPHAAAVRARNPASGKRQAAAGIADDREGWVSIRDYIWVSIRSKGIALAIPQSLGIDGPFRGSVPSRSRCPTRSHRVRRLGIADPLPHAPPAVIAQTARLAIIHQTIQNGRDRGQRILVPRQDCRSISFQLHTNLARSQRTPYFHQHPPAGLGESGLPAIGLAVDHFQQVVAQHLFAEEVGQSGNRLLHRADALHDLGPLPHQLKEFFVRRLHHLLR